MVLRSAVSLLLLASCTAAFSQTTVKSGPRAFRDPALGITYYYPQRFTPEHVAQAKLETGQTCAHSNLSGSSVTPVGTSAFVFSSVNAACPKVLQAAAVDLDKFTREQVLRQLKQYGKPEVTRDPTHYTIDGRPASITIAAVRHPAPVDPNSIAPPKMTYAAKACVLGEVPDKHSKTDLVEQTKHIVCFDFTTQHKDLLPLMLAFTVQFDGQDPEPMVPGGVLH